MTLEVYQYWISGDCEGRSVRSSGYFLNKNVCEYAAKGQDYYGGDGRVEKTTLVIDESSSPEEYEKDLAKLKKLRALQKLTEEDKIILGLV